MKLDNLFENIPAAGPEELFEDLLQGQAFRIERIVSQGHSTPEGSWYDQDQPEWVLLVKGEASLHIEGQESRIHLQPGDYLNLPAHCRHRVVSTARDQITVWLAIHYRASAEDSVEGF
ncbi:MAG: cupin domain-containing protein [Deltaproteobacteria bacterium]|nr:cupin domain-containing protein [Deltaproteobacteria bacterium]